MVNSLIENSALELAPYGVRINGVSPGITNTDLRVSDIFNKEKNQNYLDNMGEFFLLNKQVLKPNDIVNSILFLASEEAEYVTGEIIDNDNGFILNHDLSFSDTNQ